MKAFKLSLLALFPLLISSLPAQTAVESFDYSSGSSLNETTAATGWEGGWVSGPDHGDAPLVDDLTVGFGNLESAAFNSRGLVPEGNCFVSPDSAEKITLYRRLAEPFSWSQFGERYISFLVRFSGSHQSEASRILLLLPVKDSANNNLDTNRSCVGLISKGISNEMALMVRNNLQTQTSETIYPAGQTYLIVMKLEAVRGSAPDWIRASVYPEDSSLPDTEPPNWEVEVGNPVGGDLWLESIGLEMQVYLGNREITIDEIRVGDSWDAVTAKP